MKNIKKETVIFILISIFVIFGSINLPFLKLFIGRPYRIINNEENFSESIQIVDSEINNKLRYHDFLVDVESLIMRASGTSTIEKGDGETVTRATNNMLSFSTEKVADKEILKAANSVSQLQSVAKENGAEFLYVYAPEKNLDLSLPPVVDNYAVYNHNRFIERLQQNSIQVLDLFSEKENEGITVEEMFFSTDHHWKPESGLWATEKICIKLSSLYGFKYNEEYTNVDNYNIKKYKQWFLGSQGKKAGTYFSPKSPDDISLIVPKFETSIIERQPFKKEVRKGDFTQSVLYMKNLENKDFYKINAYAAYSGGDFRLQITQNNNAPNASKILIVRDSFACAVTPFLTLNCKELHTTDVRDNSSYIGAKLNLKDYINKIKPDYVIVLYTGTTLSEQSGFDFF